MKIRSFCTLVVALALLPAACAAPDRQAVTIKGSDTMVALGQQWAEVFMNEHPGATIQVTGGGSGTGIAALINGTTQICQASRPMTAKEKDMVKRQRSVDVVEIPVALDALAVYLSKANPVDHLSTEQVGRIFRGEVTSWREVGGPDAAIVLYGRENSSGTYVFFKEHVLANGDFAERYQALPGTAAVINAVMKDPAGIGYGGIGSASDIKTIAIARDAASEPVFPTMENVYSNAYPLSRQLFWYTAGEPQGANRQLLDWILGSNGQKIVTEVGYYPLPSKENP